MGRYMEDEQWYNLTPSAEIGGKRFSLVFCEFQHPKVSNEYVVRGVPDGEEEEESFVLRFSEKGRVKAVPTEPPLKKPDLQLVQ